MFDSKYKEAWENMKLSDSFKTGLVNKMKNISKKKVPQRRLVLVTIMAVLVVSTSVVFATNYATNGQLFKSVMSGLGIDPVETECIETTASETTVDLTIPSDETTTATSEESASSDETTAPTESTSATTSTETTPAETTKETTAETTKETTKETTAPVGKVAPVVSASAGDNSVTVSWNKINNPSLVGYKVVASQSCSTPRYSENGYYAWITDANTTSCTINNGDPYNSGDFGDVFQGGTSYYFSVTAIYNPDCWEKIAGNAVQVTMPGDPPPVGTYPAVTVSAAAVEDGVKVSWTKTADATGFKYYKIVASVGNSSPAYPDDGYVTYIENPDQTSYTIKNDACYNGGDFGGVFVPGTSYYFSITACYDGGNARGNAVKVKMPGEAPPPATNPAVTVSVSAVAGGVKITWTKTADATDFVFYKVVASIGNSSPAYPGDGYYKYFEDANTVSCTIKNDASYNGGDLGGAFSSGTKYWFSVTACYDGGHYAKGNAFQFTMP